MLVPFALDPGCLDADPGWTSAQTLAYHSSMIKVWEEIGLLRFGEETFKQSVLEAAISRLPLKFRKQWQLASNTFPMCGVQNHWSGSLAKGNLDTVSKSADVAFVDDARAEAEFCLKEEELSKTNCLSTEVEVCRFIAPRDATCIKRALERAQSPIAMRDDYKKTWTERFAMLALAPLKRVFIVDRYALSRHFAHKITAATGLSGLERFLRLLDADCNERRYVTLYAASVDELKQRRDEEIKSELQQVLARLPKKNVKTITIRLCRNEDFGKIAHDRYIRFEKYIWDIGSGLEVFEETNTKCGAAASFKAGDVVAEYQKIEESLAKLSRGKQIEVKNA